MFPQPIAPRFTRCRRCDHPVRADRAVKGYGKSCATLLGLTGATVDVGQDGPDLLDELGEVDHCDGWDR